MNYQKSTQTGYKSEEKMDLLKRKFNRKNLLFNNLISVLGAGSAATFFFTEKPNPFRASSQNKTPPKNTIKKFVEQTTEETMVSLLSDPKVQSYFQANKEKTDYQLEQLTKAVITLSDKVLELQTRNYKTEENLLSSIDQQKEELRQKIETIDFPTPETPLAREIIYTTTINGGHVTNLEEYLNVSAATLNTIASLGGVNEGHNQVNSPNDAGIFSHKTGTKFFFRGLSSPDSSISFREGATVELSINSLPEHVKLPLSSVSTDNLIAGSVTLEKLQTVTPYSLIGNSQNESGSAQIIQLDTRTLTFDKIGNLAVKIGDSGLALADLGGSLPLEKISLIPGTSLLGNPTNQTGSPLPVLLDNKTLLLTEDGTLSVKTGREGLQLNTLGGQLHLSQLTQIPTFSLLGNAQNTSNTPESLALNPAIFTLDKGTLSLHSDFLKYLEHPTLPFTEQDDNLLLNHIGNLGVGTTHPKAKISIESSSGQIHLGGSTDIEFDGGTDSTFSIQNTGDKNGTTILGSRDNPETLQISNRGSVGINGSSLSDASFTVHGNTAITTGGLQVGTNSGSVHLSDGVVSLGNTQVDFTPLATNWNSTGSTLLLNALDYSTIGFNDAGSRVDFIRVGGGTINLGHDGGFGHANIRYPGGIITNGGNMGIGTAFPRERLEVNGGIQFSGTLKLDGQAGHAGQVLQSNGPNLAPTWINPGSTNVYQKIIPNGSSLITHPTHYNWNRDMLGGIVTGENHYTVREDTLFQISGCGYVLIDAPASEVPGGSLFVYLKGNDSILFTAHLQQITSPDEVQGALYYYSFQHNVQVKIQNKSIVCLTTINADVNAREGYALATLNTTYNGSSNPLIAKVITAPLVGDSIEYSYQFNQIGGFNYSVMQSIMTIQKL